MHVKAVFPAVLALLMAGTVDAEVTDAGPSGFSTQYEVEVPGSPLDIYERLVSDVGKWWHGDHTLSGNAAAMYIDPRPQGCFCEALPKGGGVVHMTVTLVNPGVLLRLTGGLGPLGLMGVAGNMTFEFEDVKGATLVRLRYAVGGYVEGGLDALAPAVDGVLAEQLDRFKRYVETGSPVR